MAGSDENKELQKGKEANGEISKEENTQNVSREESDKPYRKKFPLDCLDDMGWVNPFSMPW